MFGELIQYRELLKTNVKKDIRGKYKGSFLGVLWSFINPLLQVLVYAIVFPYLMRNTGDNYMIYLVTGIIPWTFFSTVINTSASCIKVNSGIIKKVYFPREILPISSALSGLVNFFISCIIILFFCIVWGVGVSWHLLFVPLIAVIQCIFSMGLGMILAALTAYVQDLEYIINFTLMLAFYGSPIVYQLDMFQNNGFLMQCITHNPMTLLLSGYRDAFLYHVIPDIRGLVEVFLISVVTLIVGALVFKKLEKGFAEQF